MCEKRYDKWKCLAGKSKKIIQICRNTACPGDSFTWRDHVPLAPHVTQATLASWFVLMFAMEPRGRQQEHMFFFFFFSQQKILGDGSRAHCAHLVHTLSMTWLDYCCKLQEVVFETPDPPQRAVRDCGIVFVQCQKMSKASACDCVCIQLKYI